MKCTRQGALHVAEAGGYVANATLLLISRASLKPLFGVAYTFKLGQGDPQKEVALIQPLTRSTCTCRVERSGLVVFLSVD